MAIDPLPKHVKVLDPFHSSNICFARFVGRNYVWDTTTDGIGKMVPVLPKDNPIDQNNICSDYPAPYQHPMNPAPGLDDSFRTWTDPKQNISIAFDNYTHNRYFVNAGNITGYPGILKYFAANTFGGQSKEGDILGTNGQSLNVDPNVDSSYGKSITISPGRVNTFASSYSGAKEICRDIYKEYTKEECNYVAKNSTNEHFQNQDICDRAFGENTCKALGGQYPDCCFVNGSYVKSNCFPRGVSCKVTTDINDPEYLPTCAWKDADGYLDPNCIENPDDPTGDPIPIDINRPCTGRYICGVNGTDYANNTNNLCPKYVFKTICSGYEGNTLSMECVQGDGSVCSGGFTANFCGYMKKDITHYGDDSPNIREWRDNAFLSFPPIHITQHKKPVDNQWNACSGEFRAESCCLWTENDLGEFAVSGKNWMPTYSDGEGKESTGSDGWENSLVGRNALPFKEADDDCLPLGVGRERRALLVNPYIIYKGPCCVGGCELNPVTLEFDASSRCTILTEDECRGFTGHVEGQKDMDVVNRITNWKWEGSPELAGTDYGWWGCTGSGFGEPRGIDNCNCGDKDNDTPKCSPPVCAEVVPSASKMTPPNPADAIRGKMICIENMIQDPEVTNPVGMLANNLVYKKGIFITKTESTCELTRIKYNEDNFGPDNSCSYANRTVFDAAGISYNIYDFKTCRDTQAGEEELDHQLNTGAPPSGLPQSCSSGCCTCFRDWTEIISTIPGGFDAPSFKSACLSRNGVYRENSRCPHGDNARYLKSKYKNESNLEIEGYRTHCHGNNGALAGPMTCNPGEGWGKDGDISEYSKIIVEPDWTCPKSDMNYNIQYDQVWPNGLYAPNIGCITEPGFGTYSYSTIYTPPIVGTVSRVVAGSDFSVALKTKILAPATSNILIWGNGALPSMTKIPGIFAKDISVAYNHILAIDDSDEVYAWGENDNGQLNYPGYTGETRITAKKVASSSGFYPWSGFSIAIDDSANLVVWGTNGFAPTGEFKDFSIEKLPTSANGNTVSGCTEVIAGDLFAYAICEPDEKIYRWGKDGVSAPGVTGAKEIACIPYSTPDPEAYFLLVLKQFGVSYDGTPHQVGRVSLLTAGADSDLWNPPTIITEVGIDPRIDIKHISAGYNHFLALGSSGEVYAWGDNSRGQCGIPGITNARSGVGCRDNDNPNIPCPVPNNYTSISGGKYHSIGLRNTSSSLLADYPISVWGLIEPTSILNGQSQSDICKTFSGFALSSGNTLDASGCGLCKLNGITWELSDISSITENAWAIPGNPFDPVGYLGLNTRISWKNTCSFDITGISEESKLNGEQKYYNFIITDSGGITNLPGPMTRASGDEGRCRSHIGIQALMIQEDIDGCIQPGINVVPNPPFGSPSIHTRETTYSGPCWPCPQLYDSLGTEAFLYGATHGLTGRDGTLYNSYLMEIKLSGASAWNPCVWGKMECTGDGIWKNSIFDLQRLDFTSLDFNVDGSFSQGELKCCSHSVAGYQDQIQVIGEDIALACPGLTLGECWRCPGWKFQHDPADLNSMAWDGTPGSKPYFDYACAHSDEYNPQHPGCDIPDDVFGLPFGGVCTIFEYDNAIGKPVFVGITSGIGSPAAGRTMCFCGADQAGNYLQEFPTHGGPGCTFGPDCESRVCAVLPRCCSIEWNEQCAFIASRVCPACASRQSHQECQNYHALKWCADKYNGGNGWTGGKTVGLDLIGCNVKDPYEAVEPKNNNCESCVKCDLPLCRHKYNCNLKCPCGTYGLDCQPTCTDPSGSYGPYIKTTCNGKWPGEFNVY